MSTQFPQFSQSGQLAGDIRLADFSGGRVVSPDVLGAAQIPAGYAEYSENIDTSSGSLRHPKGFTKVTTTPVGGDISTLFYDDSTDIIYVGYADKIGKVTGTTITQLAGATGFTSNAIWSFARQGDYLFCVNGVDAPRKWNEGTVTLSVITSPPGTWGVGNYPTSTFSWNGRIFAFGCADQPDFLFFSSLFDVDVWTAGSSATAGGAIRIGDDGNPITACIPLANGVLVFKDPGIYFFSGDTTFTGGQTVYDQTSFDYTLRSPVGSCVSQRAWMVVDSTAYCWGRDAVYMIAEAENISQVKVQTISDLIAPDVVKSTVLHNQVCAVHRPDRNQVWFAVAKDSNSTQIDRVHIYNYANLKQVGEKMLGGWDLRTGYRHKCMANVRDIAGKVQIYSGGYSGGAYVYQQANSPNYDGAAIECTYRTHWQPLGTAANGKTNRTIILLGQQTSQNIAYSYAYDFQTNAYDSDTIDPDAGTSTWSTTGATTWGTGGGTTGTWTSGAPFIDNIRIFGKGRRIQHRFYQNLVNSDFDILEILNPITTVGYA